MVGWNPEEDMYGILKGNVPIAQVKVVVKVETMD